MSSPRTYTDETKAAVMAALLEGQSVREAAKAYDIPHSTVSNWSAIVRRQGFPDVRTAPVVKNQQVGELLIEYVEANLKTLLIQQETTLRNPEWLLKQDAASLATLHGVCVDKAIRLIEAFGRAHDRLQAAAGGDGAAEPIDVDAIEIE